MPTLTAEELERLQKSEIKLRERYKKQNEYLAGKYDRLNITIPAGQKAQVEEAAKRSGMSLNAFCRDAVLKAVNEILATEQKSNDFPEVPFMD